MASLKLPRLNYTIVSGRLTADPVLKYTQSGKSVVTMRVAVPGGYMSEGKWIDATTFLQVVAWGPVAERCNERLAKGSPVVVEGRLKSRSWQTRDGQTRYGLDLIANRVQFLAKDNGEASQDDDDLPI